MACIDPLDCTYYLVSRVTLLMTTRFKKRLQESGYKQVKPAYLWALLSLWQSDGMRVVELAREAALETSTMTGLLDRMERDGLVERTPDADDILIAALLHTLATIASQVQTTNYVRPNGSSLITRHALRFALSV